jgi:hypothetical protein
VLLEGLAKKGKSIQLICDRTLDLPAFSVVPQPTTLPRAPMNMNKYVSKKANTDL